MASFLHSSAPNLLRPGKRTPSKSTGPSPPLFVPARNEGRQVSSFACLGLVRQGLENDMRQRLSLRALLVLIALFGVVMAIVRGNDPAVRYRRTHSGDALLTVLKEHIQNGDSVEKLERLLGPASVVSIPGYRGVVEQNCRKNPNGCPEGVEESDTFLSYRAGRTNLVVQTRNGKLVNYDPAALPNKLGGVLSH